MQNLYIAAASLGLALLLSLFKIGRTTKYLKNLLFANTFIAVIIFMALATHPDKKEALVVSASIFLKSNAILLFTFSLILTTETSALLIALRDMGFPNKLSEILLLTFRYIGTSQKEMELALKAAKARGFRRETSLKCYRTYGYIFANSLVKGYYRSQKVYQSMLCRGYDPFRGKRSFRVREK